MKRSLKDTQSTDEQLPGDSSKSSAGPSSKKARVQSPSAVRGAESGRHRGRGRGATRGRRRVGFALHSEDESADSGMASDDSMADFIVNDSAELSEDERGRVRRQTEEPMDDSLLTAASHGADDSLLMAASILETDNDSLLMSESPKRAAKDGDVVSDQQCATSPLPTKSGRRLLRRTQQCDDTSICFADFNGEFGEEADDCDEAAKEKTLIDLAAVRSDATAVESEHSKADDSSKQKPSALRLRTDAFVALKRDTLDTIVNEVFVFEVPKEILAMVVSFSVRNPFEGISCYVACLQLRLTEDNESYVGGVGDTTESGMPQWNDGDECELLARVAYNSLPNDSTLRLFDFSAVNLFLLMCAIGDHSPVVVKFEQTTVPKQTALVVTEWKPATDYPVTRGGFNWMLDLPVDSAKVLLSGDDEILKKEMGNILKDKLIIGGVTNGCGEKCEMVCRVCGERLAHVLTVTQWIQTGPIDNVHTRFEVLACVVHFSETTFFHSYEVFTPPSK